MIVLCFAQRSRARPELSHLRTSVLQQQISQEDQCIDIVYRNQPKF